jgi:hypothetical protein
VGFSTEEIEPVPDSAPIAALLLGGLLADVSESFDRVALTVSKVGADVDALRRQVRQIADALEERPIIRYASLTDLGTPHFSLRVPLPIVLEEYPDQVVARWPEVEATGLGSSEPEAIWRLKQEVLDLMEDLSSSRPEGLGPEATQALQIIKRFVAPDG